MKQYMKKAAFTVAALVFFLSAFVPSAQASSAAQDITKYCRFKASSNNASFKRATDGNLSTCWVSAYTSTRCIDITLPSYRSAGGVYFRWDRAPSGWELFAYGRDGVPVSAVKGGGAGYLTQYVPIPAKFAGCKKFRLRLRAGSSADVSIAEISVYTPGNPPYYAPMWKAFSGRVDMLTFVAHPDDEDLYLSVPMVTYENEGKICETVYMTYGGSSHSRRRFEAQESAWSLGNKYYPEMKDFIDKKTITRDAQMQYWTLDSVVGSVVEMIRKYKPSVIVTHDVRGEYIHGAHILTEYAVSLAFRLAADPAKYPASAAKYGTWKAGKLYVHLYSQNKLGTMSLTKPLRAFGNKTVLQVIKNAYSRQISQLPGRALPVAGAYDMRRFGLLYTNLGPDRKHTTMFENVTADAMLKLNPWYNIVVVNRAKLQAALDDAMSRNEADYTPESWAEANLPAAIAAAQAVMDDGTSTQARVDAAAAALRDALAKLAAPEPEPTATPEPTDTPEPTATPEPPATEEPTASPEPAPTTEPTAPTEPDGTSGTDESPGSMLPPAE